MIEYKLSVKQTSNGRWYTNELTITTYNGILEGITLLDRAIWEVNELLEKYNKPIEAGEKKTKKQK